MRMSSSLFKPFVFEEQRVQNIVFENRQMEFEFRELLQRFVNKEELMTPFVLMTDEYGEVDKKRYHVLELFGGHLNQLSEKEWQQNIVQYILEQVEYQHNELFVTLTQQIEHTFLELPITLKDFTLQIDYEQFELKHLQKQLKWDIKIKEGNLSMENRCEFMIELWFALTNGAKKLIIYHFPEHDFRIGQFKEIIHYLQKLNITILCVTSSIEWLQHFEESCVHLIGENRERFDLVQMQYELHLWKERHLYNNLSDTELAIIVAYYERIQQPKLLPLSLRTFIESRKL